jgi:hypothetical protein
MIILSLMFVCFIVWAGFVVALVNLTNDIMR